MSLRKEVIFENEPGRQGMRQTMIYDDVDDKLHLHSEQECQPVLDRAKDLRGMNDGYSPDRTWKRVGTIPMSKVEELYQQGVDVFTAEGAEIMCRKLDSEWSKLKTADGKTGAKPKCETFDMGGRKTLIEKP